VATRQSEALKVVARVRRVGWPVEQMDAGTWRVTCPDSSRVQVHMTPSDVNHLRTVMRELNKRGFDRAEAAALADEEAARQAKLAEDRATNERRASTAVKKAAALARAAGPYGPAQITLDDILAEHPAPRVYHQVLITPEMAKAILERNQPTERAPWPNRPIRRADVADWVRILRGGRWRYTHQGAALDVDVRLQDGQHRLTAIAESGISAEMMVSVGMPRSNFAVIDVGRRRTAAQVLQMAGATQAAATASAIRLLYLYEVWGRDLLLHERDRVSNDIVAEYHTKLQPDDWEFALGRSWALRRELGLSVSGPAAAFYLIRAAVPHADRVEEFVGGLIRGVEAVDDDPVWVLRRQLTRQAAGLSRRLPAAAIMALIIKGWNADAQGKRTTNLVVRSDSPMPTVYAGV